MNTSVFQALTLAMVLTPLSGFLPEVIVPDCHCDYLQDGIILSCTNLHSTRFPTTTIIIYTATLLQVSLLRSASHGQ